MVPFRAARTASIGQRGKTIASIIFYPNAGRLFKYQRIGTVVAGVYRAFSEAKFGLSALLISATLGVQPGLARDLNAGVMLDEMPVRERTSYIMGVVEGLAYARFRKDTILSGEKDERGMKCIYNWFYKDSNSSLDTIEAAFVKYRDYSAALIVNALVKQECGE